MSKPLPVRPTRSIRQIGLHPMFWWLLLLAGFACFSQAYAQPVDAPLVQDTQIDGRVRGGDQNFGSDVAMRVAPDRPREGLIEFDLIGVTDPVADALLTFNVTSVGTAGNIALHFVLETWDQDVVTYNTRPASDPVPAAMFAVAAGAAGGQVAVDITAIAQVWVSDPASNFGLLLRSGNADVTFATSDAGLGATLVINGGAPPPPPPPPAEQLPVGAISMWVTDTAPNGWLLCDGRAVDRNTYAALFAAIGSTFGDGDGSNTFNLPDLRGRFPLGQDDMGGTPANRILNAQASQLAGFDGSEFVDTRFNVNSEEVTLTAAQTGVPDHTHDVHASDGLIAGSGHKVALHRNVENTAVIPNATTASGGGSDASEGHAHAVNGGTAAQDVLNPFLVVNFIIKH